MSAEIAILLAAANDAEMRGDNDAADQLMQMAMELSAAPQPDDNAPAQPADSAHARGSA